MFFWLFIWIIFLIGIIVWTRFFNNHLTLFHILFCILFLSHLIPRLKQISNYISYQKLKLSLHSFLPHILFLWHIPKPFYISKKYIYSNLKLQYPLIIQDIFKNPFIPSYMVKLNQALHSKPNNHSIKMTN